MAEVKTWTVEEIERTATGERWHADYARMQGASGAAYLHDRSAAMLRAFAAQTRQVELALAVKPSTVLIAESPEWWTEDRMRILDYGKSTAIHAMQLVLRGGAFTKDGAQ